MAKEVMDNNDEVPLNPIYASVVIHLTYGFRMRPGQKAGAG